MLKRHKILLYALTLFLATLTLYSNNLESPFRLDDYSNIVNMSRVKMQEISATSLVETFTGSDYGDSIHNLSRGLTFVSFALNYWLHGYQLFGWHLVNNLLHAINTLLLFVLLLQLARTSALRDSPYKELLVFLCVLIWSVNPVHVQTVTYIVQRLTLLATMFALLTVIFWIEWLRQKKAYMLTLTCLSLLGGFCSKEIAIVAPFFCFLYWLLFADGMQKLKANKRLWLLISAVPVVAALVILLLHGNPLQHLSRMVTTSELSTSDRLFTQFRVVWMYVSLLLLPHPMRLTIEHYVEPSQTLFSPMTSLLGGLAIFAAIMVAWRFRRAAPYLSFGILWYFSGLVLESTFIPLELMFEHRSYLPSVGIMCVVLQAVIWLFREAQPTTSTATLSP